MGQSLTADSAIFRNRESRTIPYVIMSIFRFRSSLTGRQIFARDVGTAPPAELLMVAAVKIPVKLQTDEQDMTIRPGDYIIGDINGVVVLPKELAEAAIPLMAKQVAADSAMAVEIAKGMTFTEASKKFR